MYIYESHMSGFFASEHELDYDERYCEQCGDSDTYLCEAETREELIKILKKEGHVDFMGYVDNIFPIKEDNVDMKYKIDDKVKYIGNDNFGIYEINNRIGYIEQIDMNKNAMCPYFIRFEDNNCIWSSERYLIDANSKEFGLHDIKAGYLVEVRDGRFGMAIPAREDGMLFFIEKDNFVLSGMTDYDFIEEICDNLDIMRVWGYSKKIHKALSYTTEDRDLLWERTEEPEYTLKLDGSILTMSSPLFESDIIINYDDIFASFKEELYKKIANGNL